MLWCSQVAAGNENALRLRVYGEKGGLEWAQEDPNYLWYTPLGEPKRLLTRGGAGAGAGGGAGHPDAGRASGGLPRGLRQHLRRGGAGDPGAGATGEPVPEDVLYPDDRGRRRRRGLRRGLRAVVVAQRRLGHALSRPARAPVAGARREAQRHQRRGRPARRRPGRPAGVAISRSASAMPTASRSASKWESAGTSARVSSAGKVQTTETSLPTRGRARRGRRRAPAAMHSWVASTAVGRARPGEDRAAVLGQASAAIGSSRTVCGPSPGAPPRRGSLAGDVLVVQRLRRPPAPSRRWPSPDEDAARLARPSPRSRNRQGIVFEPGAAAEGDDSRRRPPSGRRAAGRRARSG